MKFIENRKYCRIF